MSALLCLTEWWCLCEQQGGLAVLLVFQERLSPCGTVPTYIIFSGADENVPPSVDKVNLVNRFKQALGPLSRSTFVEGANHEMDGHAEEMTKLVEAFLADISGGSA